MVVGLASLLPRDISAKAVRCNLCEPGRKRGPVSKMRRDCTLAAGRRHPQRPANCLIMLKFPAMRP